MKSARSTAGSAASRNPSKAFASRAAAPAAYRWLLHAGAALVLALAWSAAMAGPVQDFEVAFRDAYGDYRAALFMTNSKDAAATAKAMSTLQSKWAAIEKRWGKTPPPQYADDKSWPEVLRKSRAIMDKARAEVGKGELAEAHETLEEFRDVFGSLHARNSVMTFSDHMNAYHAKMEEVLGANYSAFDADGRLRLAKDAAVLDYLAGNLEKFPPRDAAGTAEFKALLAALRGSLASLNSAVAAGDAAAMQKAVAGLKPSYSKFFLRFG